MISIRDRAFLVVLGLTAAVGGGCSDHGLHINLDPERPAAPMIEVTPDFLDFWEVPADETAVLPFNVRNIGGAPLHVTQITLEGNAGFSLVEGGAEFTLAPDEERVVEVAFSPLDPDEQTGVAWVHSNDIDRPTVPVDLVGDGIVPRLVIDPNPYDFGEHRIPCGESVQVTLQNVGDADLVIDSVEYDGGTQYELRDLGTLPIVLAPNDYATAWVDFVPDTPGPSQATMTVSSNDPRGDVIARQTGSGSADGSGEDHFAAPTDPPVDILFAIDQSASMDDDQISLGDNFASFIADLGQVTTGWHIGVVTYDAGCFNGGVLTAESADLETVFSDAVALGTDFEIVNDEALLQLADRALRNTDPGECNAGFLRNGALLHVIVVSDEPERSTEQAAAWTWDYWVDRMYGYVASDSLLTISGIVDDAGCNEGDRGYVEAITETGGERLSICSGEWAEHVASLAAASLAYSYTFELSELPAAGSIVVAVDGVATEEGWFYDEGQNAVVFAQLLPGAQVDVDYALAGECP